MKKITPTKKEREREKGREGAPFFCMKLDELVAGSTKSKDGAACKELREDAGRWEVNRMWSNME